MQVRKTAKIKNRRNQVLKHGFAIRGDSFNKFRLWMVYLAYYIVKMIIIYVKKYPFIWM